jgi:glyceraldehyde 3-phosphate dehydrogenase
MQKIRVGINGFGRIGRAIFRLNQVHRFFDVCLINDCNPDIENIAYQLKYDSIYGVFPANIKTRDKQLLVDEHAIAVYHARTPEEVPWQRHGIDLIIDASGVNTHPQHMLQESPLVEQTIFTHAVNLPGQVQTLIFGVNHDHQALHQQAYFSSSICDTVAAAPILKILQDNFGIASGALTTLHPWLGLQHLQDGAAIPLNLADEHRSNYALGRSAVNNLIPKTTTAIHAAEILMPGISEKISSFSYRVPTNIVSSAVLHVELQERCTREQVLDIFERSEREQQWRILNNCFEPRVSIDYCGCEYSAAIDQRWTNINNQRHLRMVYWYDNEWGYSARVLDLVRRLSHLKSA